MYQKAFSELDRWKEKQDRKPLIIKDARQVGKTWLMKKFEKSRYENAPEYHILAARSLLGVALHPRTSTPVGKIEYLNLFPMDFDEFLLAAGKENLLELIKSMDFLMIRAFKDKLIDQLKIYYYVGGMPEVVANYVRKQNLPEVRQLQENLLNAYVQDFFKHAPLNIVPRIRMLWENIPSQLARDNKKFFYGNFKKGARAREYELAMSWLIDSGLVYKINRINKPGLPLSHYENLKSFKLFILDVGLLGAMSRLNHKAILDGNRFFEEFKGALTEQYVLQQLCCMKAIKPYYWSAENSKGEIDFIYQLEDQVIPVEVKVGENLQAKSMRIFVEKYDSKNAIRLSLSDFREEDWMTNFPLYLIGIINNWIQLNYITSGFRYHSADIRSRLFCLNNDSLGC